MIKKLNKTECEIGKLYLIGFAYSHTNRFTGEKQEWVEWRVGDFDGDVFWSKETLTPPYAIYETPHVIYELDTFENVVPKI